eukprot:2454351-Rhodomonas_salina.4
MLSPGARSSYMIWLADNREKLKEEFPALNVRALLQQHLLPNPNTTNLRMLDGLALRMRSETPDEADREKLDLTL